MIGWNREKPLKTLLLKWFYLDAFTLKHSEWMTFIVINMAVFAIKT